MLRTVKVYGHLAEHCGQSVFEALVRVPADAIKFLLCNFPELRGLMRDGYYKVAVGKFDLELSDKPEQLHFPLADCDVVKVIPVVSGAGGRGLGSILAGAALIGLSLALPGGGMFGGTVFGALGGPTANAAFLTTVGTVTSQVGAALVLGGIATMITPVPKQPDFGEADPSGGFAFSGLQNVSQEGIPVPVVYGEMIVGSVVLSTGLVAHIIDEAD